LSPTTLYADAWKDVNRDGTVITGDFYGVYGGNTYPDFEPLPFDVSAGQTTTINIEVIAIP
jgi:hypothetical protein